MLQHQQVGTVISPYAPSQKMPLSLAASLRQFISFTDDTEVCSTKSALARMNAGAHNHVLGQQIDISDCLKILQSVALLNTPVPWYMYTLLIHHGLPFSGSKHISFSLLVFVSMCYRNISFILIS